MNSVEWNDGMERWNGLLEWSTGLETGLLECHAHKLVVYLYLGMRIILNHSKDGTKCMSQGSLAA